LAQIERDDRLIWSVEVKHSSSGNFFDKAKISITKDIAPL
jgi:hypothetical protein